jgi:radical SAM superfamily enzyme YgiQ (UPF0313 family)
MEPLAFAILKSLTPPDVEVVLHDERLAPVPLDEPTDLVAMTVETYTARRAYQLAVQFRRRGVPVVMGGYHATFLPDEVGHFADAVVLGDAEDLWPHVVADARAGTLRKVYRQSEYPTLAGRPQPDRSIFAGKRYAPVTMVQYARGCRFNCDFCSIHAFYGTSLRQRPVQEVCEEIVRAGRRLVFFVDDNLFVDIPKAKELFTALIPLGIRWTCQTSIDIARDRELVALMARSGCASALFGFESLEPVSLQQMRKGWNLKWQDYETSIKVMHDAGIMIYGSFAFGYDGDTTDSFDATAEFAIAHKFFLGNFNPLTPTPRAPLYDRLAREGRLIHDRWWLDPSYRYGDATFHPARMTAAELTEGCYRARSRFNSLRSMVTRFLEPRTVLAGPLNAFQYILANAISRREIHRKQGQPLGGPEPLVIPQHLAPVPQSAGGQGSGAGVAAGAEAGPIAATSPAPVASAAP